MRYFETKNACKIIKKSTLPTEQVGEGWTAGGNVNFLQDYFSRLIDINLFWQKFKLAK